MPSTALVDKNILRSETALESFLDQDPENRFVLTDFCCMESCKGLAATNLPRSIRALERFASRILILRSSREIAQLSLTSPLDTITFVDRAQTDDFSKFFIHVRQALDGDAHLQAQLDEHERIANEYLAKLQSEAAGVAPAILEIAKNLPPDTVRRLRRGEDPTIDDVEIFIPGMLLLAREFYLHHPDFGWLPDAALIPQSFVLRFAVAGYLLAIDWIRRGGIEGAPPERLGNDVVDMNYVAMATYFDDLLTKDRKMQSIYADARWYIRDVFAAQH